MTQTINFIAPSYYANDRRVQNFEIEAKQDGRSVKLTIDAFTYTQAENVVTKAGFEVIATRKIG